MPDPHWNEARTRKELIDKLLKKGGWGPILPFVEGRKYSHGAVEEYPTTSGPADYVLFNKNRAIAAVEGKKVAVGPQNVLQQAQRYARDIRDTEFNYGEHHLPFAYSTNGVSIWFQDLRHPLNRSREVAGFHTAEAMEEILSKDEEAAAKWLTDHPVDNDYLRPYQKEAIQKTEEAMLNRKRNMLIAMATGTGKTVTISNLIYRLMKSGYAKRILFLVDRKALAAQAVTTLASFEPEPGLKFDKIYEVYSQRFRKEDFEEGSVYDPKVLPNEYLTDPKSRDAFVYVCTIQRMRINLFGRAGLFGSTLKEEEDAETLDIPINAFDVIIADECHRGYTSSEESKWREVLNHFDAARVGLTATPAAHTTAFFKEIVYRYDYERAVRENYLVDYDGIAIQSDITINGTFLRSGEEVGVRDTATGQLEFDTLEDERQLAPDANESEWTAPDRNRKIIQELKTYLLKHEEEHGNFPKTLIFADNDLPHTSHCDILVDMLRDEFGRGDAFVQKITGSPTVDRPLQRIREFRNRTNPGIVVTVDMLSTGVDVPKIENIVFLRAVKSRILFEQMMGRGTRLCPEIGKSHFTVFDCFNGTLLEYFKSTTSITAEAPAKLSLTLPEIIERIADNQDREYNINVVSKRLLRISKNITHESRKQFNAILKMDIADFATGLKQSLDRDWAGTMKILQDKTFLNLCEDYERPKRTYLEAITAVDSVASRVMFRVADGGGMKPADYIQMFEDYIRTNPDHVQALEVLLNRPKDFHTDELKDLKQKLEMVPLAMKDKFTELNLRRAYNKELADIISIIRHAARGEELLTAETRIQKAFEKVKRGRYFTNDQEAWLDLIKKHMVANLLIEKDDFDVLPIFARSGLNYNKMNQIFNGELDKIINELNEAVVA